VSGVDIVGIQLSYLHSLASPPYPVGDNLTSLPERVLVYLLAKKALVLRRLQNEVAESARPSEIEKATGIIGGTLRPVLHKLIDERLLVQERDGSGYLNSSVVENDSFKQ
jgi:hypothetical protein